MARDAGWVGRLSDAIRSHERERASAPLPRYEISSEPRRGGMGAVYRAWDRQLSRQVALKVLDARAADTPEAVSRFLREAEIAARLTHPNIVPVYDSGTWGDTGRPFIVMQFIDGDTLAEAAGEPRQAAQMMIDVAKAVQYAHDHGVIHRDLKPQNLMRDRTGRVYVTDFGLAKAVASTGGSTSVAGEVLGTPVYMPPEQALGKVDEVDARSDVYALGATLYALATGRPPFGGTTSEEVRVNVVTGRLQPPSAHRTECAGTLDRIILRAMSKSRDARHESASAFARELEAYLAEAEPGPLARLVGSVPVRLAAAVVALAILAVWMMPGAPTPPPKPDPRLDEFERAIRTGRFGDARRLRDELRGHPRHSHIVRRYNEAAHEALSPLVEPLLRALAGDEPANREEQALRDIDTGLAQLLIDGARQRIAPLASAIDGVEAGSHGDASRHVDHLRGLPEEARKVALRRVGDAIATELEARSQREWLQLLQRTDGNHPKLGRLEVSVLRAEVTPDSSMADLAVALKRMSEIDSNDPRTKEVQRLLEAAVAREKARERFELDWSDAIEGLATAEPMRVERKLSSIGSLVGLGPEFAHRVKLIREAHAWLVRLVSATTPAEIDALRPDALGDPVRACAQKAWRAVKADTVARLAADLLGAQSVGDGRRALDELETLAPDHPRLPTLRAEAALLDAVAESRALAEGGQLEEAWTRADALPSHRAVNALLQDLRERLFKAAWPAIQKADANAFEEYKRLAKRGVLAAAERRARLAPSLEKLAKVVDAKSVWTSARSPLDEVIAADDTSADVRLERMVVNRRLGKLEDALADAERAVALRTDAASLIGRGQILYMKREWSKALVDFTQAASLSPDDARAIFWRASARHEIARDDALADYEACVKKHPSPLAKLRVATLSLMRNDAKTAARMADAAFDHAQQLCEEDVLVDRRLSVNEVKATARYVRARVHMLGVRKWRDALTDLAEAKGLATDPELLTAINKAIDECREKLGD